jgi:hypothetical protein
MEEGAENISRALAALAPGRVAVAFGTGFAGARGLGGVGQLVVSAGLRGRCSRPAWRCDRGMARLANANDAVTTLAPLDRSV